jgi:hypothetical protein
LLAQIQIDFGTLKLPNPPVDSALLPVGTSTGFCRRFETVDRSNVGVIQRSEDFCFADLPDGAKVLDLSEDTIQTDVELKLRLAGVRVVAKKEVSQLPGRPHLYLRVTLTSDAQAASIEVQLRQNILLERNGDSAIGVTWLETTLFSHPTSEAIRNAVKDNVDKFLNS